MLEIFFRLFKVIFNFSGLTSNPGKFTFKVFMNVKKMVGNMVPKNSPASDTDKIIIAYLQTFVR